MPRFGAHLSIAKGLSKAVESANLLEMEALQIFTSSPSKWAVTWTAERWEGKAFKDEDVRSFQAALKKSKIQSLLAHDSYLINLASPDDALRERSLAAFVDEMARAEALGLTYLVMHPGTPTDGDEEAGLKRVAESLDEVQRRCAGFKVMVLLESTAGQGKTLGHRFEHLGRILGEVHAPDRLGICLDTCHVYAAGYELAPKAKYDETMDAFARQVGMDRLKAWHLNDSQKPLGSRVDRHAAIGAGCMGLEPFRLLVNDPRFSDLPMVLETPKEDDDGNETMDRVNLETLRNLCDDRAKPSRKKRNLQ